MAMCLPKRAAALVVSLGVVLSACTSPQPEIAQPSATEEPVRGGSLVQSGSDPPHLQPIMGGPQGFLYYLYEALTPIAAADGRVIDGMAKLSQSRDGRTFTLDIAGNASWSDDQPVVAEDWRTAVKAVALGNTKCAPGVARCSYDVWTTEWPDLTRIVGWADFVAGRSADISGVRADGKRLTVELSEVRCAAATLFGVVPPLPTHVFGRYAGDARSPSIEDAPANLAPTVFSGPFLLKEWRKGDHLTLGRNDRYWRGPPLLDEIVYKFIAASARVDQILKGGVMGGLLSRDTDVRPLEGLASVRVHRVPRNGYTYIGWNTASSVAPALRDVRVRQALAYGLDLDRFIRDVEPDLRRVHAHFPPTSWAHTPGLPEYRYDPARASSLLRAAGYEKSSDGVLTKEGRPLAIRLTTNANNPLRLALLQFAADQYGSLGIRIVKDPRAFADVLSALNSGDVDGVIIGWTLPPDPDPIHIFHSAGIPGPRPTTINNWMRYVNAEVDRVIAAANGPADGDCSIATRKRHYATVDGILNDEQPVLFGFMDTDPMVIPANLRGFAPDAFHLRFGYPNIYRWWLAKRGSTN